MQLMQEQRFLYLGTICIFAFGILLARPLARQLFGMLFKRSSGERKQAADSSRRLEAVVAAIMAYSIYVAAAILAGAAFPMFLREHLFDGLAPAALVGFLVNSFPRDSPRTAFPWIRLPIMIAILFGIGGGLIFGLIAAAAVFTSGSKEFAKPVIFARYWEYMCSSPDTFNWYCKTLKMMSWSTRLSGGSGNDSLRRPAVRVAMNSARSKLMRI
jgi:hypothetical protein